MSECKCQIIFISRQKAFKICIYHRDPKKQHPSLYCISNDHEAYPVSIELLNSKQQPIDQNNNRHNKIWKIISASTDFKIKHSYCQFTIQFDSLPHYIEQPLQFRFKATSNNPKIPHIEPFTTRAFRVVYVLCFYNAKMRRNIIYIIICMFFNVLMIINKKQ